MFRRRSNTPAFRGKLTALILSFLILCVLFPAVVAERPVRFDPLDVYRGRVGWIGFALPGIPVVAHEPDVEDLWTDSVQLFGDCGIDGGEYQFRTADIAPLLERIRAGQPDAEDSDIEKEALEEFATLYIHRYEGTVSEPRYEPEDGLLTFTYTYPDTPGATYSAKCYLTGTVAACLLMENCDHTEKAFSQLAPLTFDERSAFQARTPVIEDMMGIDMLFPYEPYVFTDDRGVVMAFCFTNDYSRIIAQYLPVGLDLSAGEDEVMDSMKSLAESVVGSLGEEEPDIQDGTLSGSAALWQYDFTFPCSLGYNEIFREKWLGRIFAGENGIWYLTASDGNASRGFLNSCDLSGAPEKTQSTGLWIKAEMALAKDRTPGKSPSALRQFIRDFWHLLDTGIYRDIIPPEDMEIGEAVYADGQWIRTLSIGSSDLYALLLMSSDEPTAVVNEIHVLCGEDVDYRYGSWFTACCIRAAEGAEKDDALDQLADLTEPDPSFSWQGRRYQADCRYVDRSDFHYYLMTVKASEPEPAVQMSEDWSVDGLSASDPMTVQEFYDEWDKTNRELYGGLYPLEIMDSAAQGEDGTEMYSAVFGDTTFVILICKPDGKQLIDRIHIWNLEQFPPQTYMGGLFAHKIISRMPSDQFVRMLLMQQEYPLWEDLVDMYPVAGWNGKMLLLTDDEFDDMYIPAAMIATFQKE